MARSTKLERSPSHVVDPRDEPSAEWGWHGGFPKATKVAGWISAAAMFLMLIGNHEGNIANIWLICIGTAMVVVLTADQIRSRKSWRR